MLNIVALPPEIISHILEQLDPGIETINIDRRGYVLSEISLIQPGVRDDACENLKAVGNFRRTCLSFSKLGAHHMFRNQVIRFSSTDFLRLQEIAKRPDIAKAVRKLTYMVPRFFSTTSQVELSEYLALSDPLMQRPSFRKLLDSAQQQTEITNSQLDYRALRDALTAFISLQHVQILHVQTAVDEDFTRYIQRDPFNAAGNILYEWGPAIIHASKSVGRAMVCSGAMLRDEYPVNRLSTQIDLDSATLLLERFSESISIIANCLECLSIRFENYNSPDRVQHFISLLRNALISCMNIVSLHLGFPQQATRLSLTIVFGGIALAKLRVLSIDGWRLTADDIISVIRQYSCSLRGLRLRGVILEVGEGLWRDVLTVIRKEVQLNWISLRRINYASAHDSLMIEGFDISDDEDVQSESSIEGSWEQDTRGEDGQIASEDEDGEDNEGASDYDEKSSIADSDMDSESVITSWENERKPETLVRDGIRCCCSTDPDTIGDYGQDVQKAQWKFWERWAIGRKHCSIHGERSGLR